MLLCSNDSQFIPNNHHKLSIVSLSLHDGRYWWYQAGDPSAYNSPCSAFRCKPGAGDAVQKLKAKARGTWECGWDWRLKPHGASCYKWLRLPQRMAATCSNFQDSVVQLGAMAGCWGTRIPVLKQGRDTSTLVVVDDQHVVVDNW